MSQTNQTNNIAYIYNPANYSEEELIKNFIVRLDEFNSIFQVIKNDDMKHPPQHFIIQGLRGNGKTTLLQRLYYEVKNDTKLNKKLIPVIFDEEEYGIRKLYKLWERIAENVEDNYPEFKSIYDEMMKHVENNDYEETAYKILKNKLHDKGMKLVLFFDNFGEVLEKFNEKETRRLREILMGENFLRIVGASSIMLESFYDYSKPFYEFFKIIQLNGLTKSEAFEFLKKMAENYKRPDVKKMIEEHPERVETLRVLTEGVPRTMILLFEIFADSDNGESFKDLELVLDRVTPLYKHRMDDLSEINQEIIDIIARNWDGIEVSTIAERSKMDSKSISSQLNVLYKNNIISKISTSTKNNLYILKERFFNIWYLMRYGRKKDENRVKWLTRFLEAWFGGELEDRAMKHIKALQEGGIYDKHAYYMCEAISKSLMISIETQYNLLNETNKYLEEKGSDYAKNLTESDLSLLNKARESINNQNLLSALNYLKKIKRKNDSIIRLIASYSYELKELKEAEQYSLVMAEKGDDNSMTRLGILYDREFEDDKKAEKYYKMAADRNNDTAMLLLGGFYENRQDLKNAEKYYKMAADIGNSDAMVLLGTLYSNENDYETALEYYLNAAEKGNEKALFNVGFLYDFIYKDLATAEKYYLLSAEKGFSYAMTNLANLYFNEEKIEEAEKYLKIAVKKDDRRAMNNLAFLYFKKQKHKKESYYLAEKAIKKDRRIETAATFAFVSLWNDKIEEGVNAAKEFLSHEEVYEKFPDDITRLLIFMMAKNQYNSVLNIFNENKFDIKDRFKPVYYALMYFMKDKFPNEYLKMGSELKETVEEIIKEVEKYRNW